MNIQLALHKDVTTDASGNLSYTLTTLGSCLRQLTYMWEMTESEVMDKLAVDAVIKEEKKNVHKGVYCKNLRWKSKKRYREADADNWNGLI